jgi:DNA (cytosine-5)-methyltransferase 1
MKPVFLDLFCKAGGITKGLQRAGAYVIGIDIEPQPNYCGDEFIQGDALDVSLWPTDMVAIFASPPCQAHSTQTADKTKHVDLIPQTREALVASGLPYVIENVEGARRSLVDPVRLCGSSFGLDVRRHRYFESNWQIVVPSCDHSWQAPRFRSLAIANHRAGKLATVVGVHGHINYPGEFAIRCKAMGIDWMTNDELTQAIPPAYAEHIGRQLMNVLAVEPAP